MRIVGCDPGFTGAVACRDTATRTVEIADMPVNTIRTSTKKNRAELDLAALAAILRDMAPDVAVVEAVNAMPGQGVTSMFRFGQSFGATLGVLAGLGIETHLVAPQVWRRACRVKEGKDGSRARASQLYPQLAQEFRRVKDHGRADAALIAYWGELELDDPF